jgi:hypothetical protein
MLTATVGYSKDGVDSAQAVITATGTGDGVRFSIELTGTGNQLIGDLRGLYLDLVKDVPVNGDSYFSDTSPEYEVSDATELYPIYRWMNDWIVKDENAAENEDITQVQWGENKVINLGTGANMNGNDPSNAPPESYSNNIFDLGIEIGTQGDGKDSIDATDFFVQGISESDLKDQLFGLRLTGTTGAATSLKLVGKFTDSVTTDDWEGLSPGYWKNWSPQPPGNQVNDWNQDPIIYANGEYKTFENIFNVDPGRWLVSPTVDPIDDVTMLQALQLGADIKGGLKKNALARQATAALLNTFEKDETDPNGAVNYKFTTQNVLDWTSDALSADWQMVAGSVSGYTDTSSWTTQQATVLGLADLFAQNNNLGLYG